MAAKRERFRFPMHLVTFLIYLYSLVYDIIYLDIGWQGYGGKFKYLTFLDLIKKNNKNDTKLIQTKPKDKIIQTVFFGLSALSDSQNSNAVGKDGRKTGLKKFLDTFLASVAYPVGTFVVMTFWGIYFVDRELVYPKRLDKIIPQWLNHVMHTTVLPFLVVEKYMVHHEYPSRKKGLAIMMAFATAYLVWILWIAYYADIWVYPILQVMEAHQRAIFISVLMGFFASIYILGESLNRFFWRKVNAPIRTTRKTAKKIS